MIECVGCGSRHEPMFGSLVYGVGCASEIAWVYGALAIVGRYGSRRFSGEEWAASCPLPAAMVERGGPICDDCVVGLIERGVLCKIP